MLLNALSSLFLLIQAMEKSCLRVSVGEEKASACVCVCVSVCVCVCLCVSVCVLGLEHVCESSKRELFVHAAVSPQREAWPGVA